MSSNMGQSEQISDAGKMNSASNTAVVVLNAGSSNKHLRTNTRALVEIDDSPKMTAKITVVSPKGDSSNQQLAETSKVSKVTVSQSYTRRSQAASSTSMQAIREVQELLKMQSTDCEYNENFAMPRSPTHNDIMIHPAIQGQPAHGVGQEIQRKREKMKDIYKQGMRKPVPGGLQRYKNRQHSALGARPPTGLSNRRAASVLDSSVGGMGCYASQSSFSIQGSSIQHNQPGGQNPYQQVSHKTPLGAFDLKKSK